MEEYEKEIYKIVETGDFEMFVTFCDKFSKDEFICKYPKNSFYAVTSPKFTKKFCDYINTKKINFLCEHDKNFCVECSKKYFLYCQDYAMIENYKINRFQFIYEHCDQEIKKYTYDIAQIAFLYGYKNIVEYLYNKGFPYDNTYARYFKIHVDMPCPKNCGWNFNLTDLKFLIEVLKINVNCCDSIMLFKQIYLTFDRFEEIKYLYENGINLHARDNKVFDYALVCQNIELMEMLIKLDAKNKIDYNFIESFNVSSMQYIYIFQHTSNMNTAEWLLKNKIPLPKVSDIKKLIRKSIYEGYIKFIRFYMEHVPQEWHEEFINYILSFILATRNFYIILCGFSQMFNIDLRDEQLFEKLIENKQIKCIKFLLDNIYPATEEEYKKMPLGDWSWGKIQLNPSTNQAPRIRKIVTVNDIYNLAIELNCYDVAMQFKKDYKPHIINEICAICINDEMVDPTQLPCKHKYCKICITHVMNSKQENSNKCPLCRQVFTKESLIYIK